MSAEEQLSALKALIKKSRLEEVPSVESSTDSCGKPILKPSGTILRHKGYNAEVAELTKWIQKCAAAQREISGLRSQVACLERQLAESDEATKRAWREAGLPRG